MPTGIYDRTKSKQRKPLSEETRIKIGLSNRGKLRSEEAKKRMSESHKGYIHPKSVKEKMSMARKSYLQLHPEVIKKLKELSTGRKISEETRQKMKTRYFSEEHRKKLSLAAKGNKNTPRGEKNPLWKGGITPLNSKIRSSMEYKLWRKSVFERDNYTCVWCNIRGSKLQADHIKPFALFPELRLAIDNGRTLCVPCHRKTDTFGGRKQQKEIDDLQNQINELRYSLH